MLLKARWLLLCIVPVASLMEGCECDDCGRGPIQVAWVKVRTSASTGLVSGIPVQLERNGFVPLVASTDTHGVYTLEALEALDGEQATLVVAPLATYATPEPQGVALAVGDTVAVDVVLEPAP